MDENNAHSTRKINEHARLAELRALDILDSPAEVRFDRYTRLVAQIFKVPMAIISLVDEDRQWFKSSVGMEVRETPLEVSFCVHAIEHDLMEVADAQADDFFCHHKAVVGPPFIRFYAGTVLRGPTGQPLGTLCIVDMSPRHLTKVERFWLVSFGLLVEELILHDAALAVASRRMNHVIQRNSRAGLPDETLFGDTLTNLIRLAGKDDHYLAILHLRLKTKIADCIL